MDNYVGRSLKNWVASQPQPPTQKEALLRRAGAPVESSEPVYFHSNALLHAEFFSHRMANYYTGGLLRGSFTVSLGWPVQLVTMIHMAA